MIDHFGLVSVAEVTAALHNGDLPALRLSELCPAVFAARDEGDEIAAELVERLASEIARMALTVLCRLQLATAPDPEVVLGGSVLAAGHKALLDDVELRLRTAVPNVRPVVCAEPPLLGAALAALDLHPDPAADAEARLRAGFRGAAPHDRLRPDARPEPHRVPRVVRLVAPELAERPEAAVGYDEQVARVPWRQRPYVLGALAASMALSSPAAVTTPGPTPTSKAPTSRTSAPVTVPISGSIVRTRALVNCPLPRCHAPTRPLSPRPP